MTFLLYMSMLLLLVAVVIEIEESRLLVDAFVPPISVSSSSPTATTWTTTSSTKVAILNNVLPQTRVTTPHARRWARRSHLMLVGAVREEIYLDLDADHHDDDDNIDMDDLSNYDEMSYQEAMEQRQTWLSQLRRLAKSSSLDRTAIPKAEQIFDTMFQAYIASEDGTPFWPDTQVYNYLLEAHAFARDDDNDNDDDDDDDSSSGGSNYYNGAIAAQQILERMEDPENTMVSRPDAQSYSHVMNAWAIRSNPSKAIDIFQRQIDRSQEKEDDKDDGTTLLPTVDGFNKLIKAYGIAGDVDRAYKIFQQMLPDYDDDDDDDDDNNDIPISPRTFGIVADSKSWAQMMKTYIGNGQTDQAKELYEELIFRNEARDDDDDDDDEEDVSCFELTTDIYNQVMRFQSDPRQAEQILFDMIAKKDPRVRPNTESFRCVLRFYNYEIRNHKKTKRELVVPLSAVAAKVEQLIQILDGLQEMYGSKENSSSNGPHDEDLQLDDFLCRLALSLIARSTDPKKASIGQRVLDRFQSKNVPLTIGSYHNLLRACAFTRGSNEDRYEAFQIATRAYNTLDQFDSSKDDNDRKLHSRCTGTYLKSMAHLINTGQRRDTLAEDVFTTCCEQGNVNDFVLEQFGLAASPTVQLKVLGGLLEDDPIIPKKWTRNYK